MNSVNRHNVIDHRSLDLHRRIRSRFLKDPLAVRQVATDNLARWKAAGSWGEAYDEWTEILKGSDESVSGFLIQFSERATRLRQSSPFPGVLNEDERMEIFKRYSQENTNA